MTKIVKPRAGDSVILVGIPPGLLDGLPDDDQRAITAIVGKPIKFLGYDDIGRAELEFDDPFVLEPGITATHTRSGSSPGSSSAIDLPRRAARRPGRD